MLTKEDIVTAKAIARQLQDSPSDNLVIVGLLLARLIEENEQLKATRVSIKQLMISEEDFNNDRYA